MATNIPPHNLGEVIDGVCATIDNPDITHEQLLQNRRLYHSFHALQTRTPERVQP